ncbi:MAG: hypothetical protein EOO89_14265, partial [Pedobacter sp.]
MNKFSSIIAVTFTALLFTACEKDEQTIIVPPPSDGSTLTLNGLAGAEAGASAGNSVFVDFSKDIQTSVERTGWDLGLYAGSDFKVILNYTTGGSVVKINKTDINAVTAVDFDPNALLVGGASGDFTLYDDPTKANLLQSTAIAEISATEADNKVYILNRAANSVSPVSDLYKVRILRNGTSGYTVQYAKVNETTFKTVAVQKDAAFNFQFVSLANNSATTVEPAKADWDIIWGFSIYYTPFGALNVPYTFSDLVFINNI